MRAGPFAISIGLSELLLHGLVRGGQENDLAVCRLRHRLHSLQVPDLHCGRRAQDVGRLAHQFRGLDFCARGNDFGFTDSFGLRGHGEGVLQFGGENDVFN